jgi:hypothetical protein
VKAKLKETRFFQWGAGRYVGKRRGSFGERTVAARAGSMHRGGKYIVGSEYRFGAAFVLPWECFDGTKLPEKGTGWFFVKNNEAAKRNS